MRAEIRLELSFIDCEESRSYTDQQMSTSPWVTDYFTIYDDFSYVDVSTEGKTF